MPTIETQRKLLALSFLLTTKTIGHAEHKKNPESQLCTSRSAGEIMEATERAGQDVFDVQGISAVMTGFEKWIQRELEEPGWVRRVYLSNYFITKAGEQRLNYLADKHMTPSLQLATSTSVLKLAA